MNTNELLTIQNITFALGILGVIFGIYRYFRDPQIKSETKEALLDQRFRMTNEANDKRFSELQSNIATVLTQSQNHIHTVDTKVEALTTTVNLMGKDIVKLTTLIEERIPRKS